MTVAEATPARAGRDVLPQDARRVVFAAYLGLVIAAGLACIGLLAAYAPRHGFTGADIATWLVCTFVVLAVLQPVVMPQSYDAEGLPVSVTFLLALTVTTGPLVPVVLAAVTSVVMRANLRRAPWRIAFNCGQYAVSWTATWAVLAPFGVAGTGHGGVTLQGGHLGGIVIGAIVYVSANNLLVSIAVRLHDGGAILPIWWDNVRGEAPTAFPLLVCAPLVVAVMQSSPWLVPLLLLPLAAVHLTVRLTKESEKASLYDALTGLPNRQLLRMEIEELVAAEAAGDGPGAALLLLDVDRFKEVNDTLGHDAGDALLVQIAQRLHAVMRPGDVVARLGGDEFAVLLPWTSTATAAADVATRVERALEAPFEAGDMLLQTEASVGVALFPQHAHDVETLIRCADVAMYQAKAARLGVQVYHPDSDHHTTERLALLGDLRRALDERTLAVHFQPMANAHTAQVEGVEALVRWTHPRRGFVPPDEFVPLAEQSGLMRPLTEFVLDESLRQIAEWRRLGMPITVSVNISARDLCDRGFVPHVRRCLRTHGVPGSSLVLEVTERVLADDDARAVTALDELTDMGIQVSLDDFGTGYSSLGRLEALPVGEIKVDRSFVRRLDADDDAPIVRSVVDLAHAMGLAVVAEGVETARAWRTLADWGCDVIQGWYLAKAMPAADMTAWLQKHQGRPFLVPVSDDLADDALAADAS